MNSVEGKVAIVTGGGSGIGEASSEEKKWKLLDKYKMLALNGG